MRWLVSTADPTAVARLARELGIPQLVARLLVVRGLAETDAAYRFLNPSLDQLNDPYRMTDMGVAVERLRRAIANHEKILIYGDYDVDGTMAAVVLLAALRRLGGDVQVHIPDRFGEGYGMRIPVIQKAAESGQRVVVSVDTGVREFEVLGHAATLGLDCIVTDHHLPDERLPPACAILNPHRTDCLYPNKNLSGVGVAFKLAQALLGMPGPGCSERLLQSYLKIVAIGTIADVVPLLGENRTIAHYGLAALGNSTTAGLGALLEVSGLSGATVTAGDIGFRLAPRLNAAGRMESARDVIDLLTATEPEQARLIAERLDRLNRERQQVEEQILAEIVGQLEGEAERQDLRRRPRRPVGVDRYSLVFSGNGWHRGVIGIVAQRLAERYHRPSLVVAVDDGTGTGSGRSIAGFHLLDSLDGVGDLFERYGGHAQAAGFTIRSDQIAQLESRFESYARSVLQPQDLEPVLRIDGEVSLLEVDRSLYGSLQKLAPHGVGNPTPVFAIRNLRLMEPPRLLKEKHLKLQMGQGGRSFDAIGWGWGSEHPNFSQGQLVDAAFTLNENVYQGRASLQLVLRDIQPSEGIN